MADQATDKVDAIAPAVEAPTASGDNAASEQAEAPKTEAKPDDGEASKESQVNEEPKSGEPEKKGEDATAPAETTDKTEDKPAEADAEMKEASAVADAQEASTLETAADTTIDATADTTTTETPSSKNNNRRKSTGGGAKGKTLSKKASKAKITHKDAKPGDHFLVKLKGFPAWPAIVCDEDMLPEALLTTRPVTAARKDGTYNENYADGGKRVNDRTFPVMYLKTWEFGWVANTFFTELSPEKARDSINDKMRKDLKAAFELAAEGNPVEHYKDMLREFQEDLIKRQEEAEAAAAAAATPKKSKKAKAAEDEDVDMADAGESAKAKSKKRKADDDTSTPQRSDSVKKPKIKLNTSSTPKTANGASAAKKEDSAAKPPKPKKQKSKDGAEKAKSQASKEDKMTPEERHARKEKEVMYLRHKLQRGLLTRDQQPQESEMQQMSEYVTILEKLKDLEVSIIRATKINKVLKAICKLENIPKEEEFKFKPRSQALLDKWNKLMDDESGAANGVNGAAEKKKPESNGTKAAAPEVSKLETTADAEPKKETEEVKAEAPQTTEEPAKAETAPETSEAVEATA